MVLLIASQFLLITQQPFSMNWNEADGWQEWTSNALPHSSPDKKKQYIALLEGAKIKEVKKNEPLNY